jgi:hypothetical protein
MAAHIYAICHECDKKIYSALLLTKHEDECYCQECFDNLFFKCQECGEIFDMDEKTEIDGEDYCTECKNEHFYSCDHCHELIHESDITSHQDNIYCESCFDRLFFRCDGCGEYFPVAERQEHEREEFCSECFDESYFVCDTCGESCCSDDYASDGTCIDCYENASGGRLLDHDADILNCVRNPYCGPQLIRTTKAIRKTRYFGLEIETDGGREYSEIAVSDIAILKHDGTCSGPEIVTIPATLDNYYNSDYPLPSLLSSAIEQGCKGSTGCDTGMHIHVSKSSLTTLTIGKMIVFVNAIENRSFMTLIMQRSFNQWCQVKTKKITDTHYNPDRYEAINLQNDKTVEFRIFKSNLRMDRVLKNIEFVQALCEYCANIAGLQDLHYSQFIIYVIKNKKLYRNLFNFLGEKSCV